VRLVRGELDWIVMKALEKDRNRRYETANALAADVQHYLQDEPVQACPPSAAYRFRKFAQRNKGPVAAVALVLLTLIAGIIGTTWGLVLAEKARQDAVAAQLAEAERAEGERRAAEAEKRAKETAEEREAETRAVLDFVENNVFAAARPEGQAGGLGRDVTLRGAIEAALPFVKESFRDQPLIEARLRMTVGRSFSYLGEAKIAAEQCEAARTLYTKHRGPEHSDTLKSMVALANSFDDLGRYADALNLREETLTLYKARLGPDHPNTLGSTGNLALSYRRLGRYADALKLREETLALQKAKLGLDHPDTLISMNNLASSYALVGRHAEALKLRVETLALRRAKLGADHPDTLRSMSNLSASYYALGRYADSLKLDEETLALRKARLGPNHPETLQNMGDVASGYDALGRHADGLKLHEEALALTKANRGLDHPETLRSMGNVAICLGNLGRHADALRLREETLSLRRAKLGPEHPDTLESMWRVVQSLIALNRGREAVPMIDEFLKRAVDNSVRPGLIPTMIPLRMQQSDKAKDAAGWRAMAEMCERLKPTDWQTLYNLACIRAITAAAIRSSDKSETAAKDVNAEADRAIAWLKQAISAGFTDIGKMKRDKDLDALRDREDFQKLLTNLEANQQKQKK